MLASSWKLLSIRTARRSAARRATFAWAREPPSADELTDGVPGVGGRLTAALIVGRPTREEGRVTPGCELIPACRLVRGGRSSTRARSGAARSETATRGPPRHHH